IMNLMNEGYELIVPIQVMAELRELSTKAKKFSDRGAAFLALKILDVNKIKILPVEGRYADEAIINLVRIGSIVATLDLELRRKLRNFRKIVIQGNKKLVFE
ncbi:MAG: hypothetical protein Q8L27_03845, partial [archaeon]|nr:hypothetical protein [archaeon]